MYVSKKNVLMQQRISGQEDEETGKKRQQNNLISCSKTSQPKSWKCNYRNIKVNDNQVSEKISKIPKSGYRRKYINKRIPDSLTAGYEASETMKPSSGVSG